MRILALVLLTVLSSCTWHRPGRQYVLGFGVVTLRTNGCASYEQLKTVGLRAQAAPVPSVTLGYSAVSILTVSTNTTNFTININAR